MCSEWFLCYRRKADFIRTNLLNIQSTTTVSSSDYEKFLTAGSTNWSTIKTQLHVTSIVHVREYFWNNDNDNNDNDKDNKTDNNSNNNNNNQNYKIHKRDWLPQAPVWALIKDSVQVMLVNGLSYWIVHIMCMRCCFVLHRITNCFLLCFYF